MSFNIGFQIKHILNPLDMLFHPAKFLLKTFSISCKILPTYSEKLFHLSTMEVPRVSYCTCVHVAISQGALNTWRGRLQHFLQLLYNQKIQKVILIWFVHLLKSNKFPEFHRCGSKNVPATPIFILNFPRAWQSFKVSYALQILVNHRSFIGQHMIFSSIFCRFIFLSSVL